MLLAAIRKFFRTPTPEEAFQDGKNYAMQRILIEGATKEVLNDLHAKSRGFESQMAFDSGIASVLSGYSYPYDHC